MTTKVHAAVTDAWRPLCIRLTGGESHDVTQAADLIAEWEPQFVIGDKAYDSDDFRKQIRRQGAKPVIPSRQGARRRRYDRKRYKLRNVAERFFGRLKNYRRVATRYDKTAVNYFGFVALASIIIQL